MTAHNAPQFMTGALFLSETKSTCEATGWLGRFPATAAGIQVNHCKNPRCANFGVPPKAVARPPGSGHKPKAAPPPESGDYLSTQVKGVPYLKCQLCRESIPLQSNLAIAEELLRIDPPTADFDEREQQLNHGARLLLRASLSSVDRFFMQIRRGITMAERGVISASADRRLWFGKNAYDPDHLAKLLEIFRVYFNYCEVGEDKKTPAVRLGLARGPVASEDILYFTPEEPERQRAPRTTRPKEKSPTPHAQGGALNEAPRPPLSTP